MTLGWPLSSRIPVAPHAVSVLVPQAVGGSPALEPLTLDEGKLVSGLDWAAGDPRDGLMTRFIAAARSKVEQDTGLALLTQTRDIFFDAISGSAFTLPAQSKPLQSVTSFKSTDSAGVVNTLDPTQYVIDLSGARIGLALGGGWPTDLRPFQPYVLRIVSGWTSVALLTAAEPMLVHLVGRLVAHYATLGRDLATIDAANEVPFGYTEDIAPYVPVVVA